MKRFPKSVTWIATALILLALGWLSFRPVPIEIEVAQVTEGPLVVTVVDDGETRVKERYVVSSPLTGRLSRIQLDEGADVVASQTPIAFIEPADPQLLDARSLKTTKAMLQAAEAALERAEADLEQAASEQAFAKTVWERQRNLHEESLISEAELEQASFQLQAAGARLKSAGMAVQMAAYEREQAQAALTYTSESIEDASTQTSFPILAPISGKVLRVFQESSAVVTPGTPLVELGDPRELEVIVDVLSTDAVRIAPDARVILDHWGGDRPLNGVVRLVEPTAFTKLSALGVEEQRVWVVIDFTDPWEERSILGDGYHLEPQIVLQESNAVVKVPTGALFRRGEDWAVFLSEGGRARLRTVQRGPSDGIETAIESGLEPGQTVIQYPSAQVVDGALVKPRS